MESIEIEIKGGKGADMGTSKICDVNIKRASNGWTVMYREKKSVPGRKDCDHVESTSESLVFTSDQEDEAFEKFKSLKKMETDSYWY